MHDLKHLNKKSSFQKILKTGFVKRTKPNNFKRLDESKKQKKKLRLVLPLIAVVIAIYPLLSIIKSLQVTKTRTSPRNIHKAVPAASFQDAYRSFRLTSKLMGNSRIAQGKMVTDLVDGGTVSFTVKPGLQNHVHDYMKEKKVPYGVFVAIEPKTGKILALTGFSSIDPNWAATSCFNLYPMASLFKIITASAALEMKKVEPDTMFSFRGYSYSENPRRWSLKPGETGSQIQLSLAMGKSINPVFGRLASDFVGKDTIMAYVSRFGFNQELFPGSEILPSRAAVPRDDSELKLMGAGLGREVKISPLHAAVMMAAIANRGTMMAPFIAEEITDKDKRVVITESPQFVRRLVTTETADKLSRMLLTTVTSGTSRKAFHDRHGRRKLSSLSICAKTGSISGKEPEGNYSWFAAFAPAENPEIALVALVINKDKWVIKASQLGEEALEAYYADQLNR